MKTTDGYPTHELIAARAYELYASRGYEDGHDMEDWIRAESELRSRIVSMSGATTQPATTRTRAMRAESRS